MASYGARVLWERAGGEDFAAGRYSRSHAWAFDGGQTVRASASPLHVPRGADPFGVDPEEAYVAALSSCHMLGFLYLASRGGLTVERYDDEAVGFMERDAQGREWIARVLLRPRVAWAGAAPDAAAEDALHHRAHDACYLANSVRTVVTCEPIR